NIGLISPDHEPEPLRIVGAHPPQVVESVLSSRRTDECRPAPPVSQHWADDLAPYAGALRGKFVHDHAIEIGTSQTVGIIRSVQPAEFYADYDRHQGFTGMTGWALTAERTAPRVGSTLIIPQAGRPTKNKFAFLSPAHPNRILTFTLT